MPTRSALYVMMTERVEPAEAASLSSFWVGLNTGPPRIAVSKLRCSSEMAIPKHKFPNLRASPHSRLSSSFGGPWNFQWTRQRLVKVLIETRTGPTKHVSRTPLG